MHTTPICKVDKGRSPVRMLTTSLPCTFSPIWNTFWSFSRTISTFLSRKFPVIVIGKRGSRIWQSERDEFTVILPCVCPKNVANMGSSRCYEWQWIGTLKKRKRERERGRERCPWRCVPLPVFTQAAPVEHSVEHLIVTFRIGRSLATGQSLERLLVQLGQQGCLSIAAVSIPTPAYQYWWNSPFFEHSREKEWVRQGEHGSLLNQSRLMA